MAGKVEVEGLASFRKELRALEGETAWARELTRAMRSVAQQGAAWAQAEATGMGGQQQHFAGALAGRAAGTTARIEVAGERTPAGKARGNPAFWGTKAQGNWIGSSWDVGDPSAGPYAINAALFKHDDDLLHEVMKAIDDVAHAAFPN